MKCERLRDLVKTWYFKVQDETLAPARMVSLISKHISQCEECILDSDVKLEARKIKEFVMPSAKASKPRDTDKSMEEAKVETEDATVDEVNETEDEVEAEEESEDDDDEVEDEDEDELEDEESEEDEDTDDDLE